MKKQPIHLRLDYMSLCYTYPNDFRHAQTIMKELGITYQNSTPQTICDQWWFWNCENVPDSLPNYIEPLNLDPMECIGWGLSEEDAVKIKSYSEMAKLNQANKQ